MNVICVFLYKAIRKLVFLYKRAGEKECIRHFENFGTGSSIQYPFNISHHERINIGRGVTILSNARMQIYPELTGLDSRIRIGDGSFITYSNSFLAGGNITIGKQVLMASNILITSENHGMDPMSETPYMDQKLQCKDVNIGDGVWIGQGVIILPGVTIGKKSIIGAGAVVAKSIPDYCIAGGVPAKVIKRYNFERHCWECVD
ncbi:MAG: acyltransferase [Clostridium sp.]|nr:acyltransferase [Clostridium sp.]